MNLPTHLFRGDRDQNGRRKLRETLRHNNYFTNLINGGDGSRILKEPLLDLVNQHVLSTYQLSDFLSFTEDRLSAFRYAMHLHEEINQEIVDECCDYYEENDNKWDFAHLTFSFSAVEITGEPATGVYEARYAAEQNEFKPYYRIIIIDVVKALHAKQDRLFNTAIEYAGADKEWLILPAFPKKFPIGPVQLASLLDGGCIKARDTYKVHQHLLDEVNTISY